MGVCFFCAKELAGRLAPHLCGECGLPQTLRGDSGSPDEDYFAALDAPAQFQQNLPQLEKRFYEISRALHPDRFAGLSPHVLAELNTALTGSAEGGAIEAAQLQKISLLRMTFLNQAYRTLKTRAELRNYLLRRDAIHPPASAPAGLALEWFELQDELTEIDLKNPEARGLASRRLSDFLAEIHRELDQSEADVRRLEDQYDQDFAREHLEKISAKLQHQSYLKSLSRDVERAQGQPKLAADVAHGKSS